MCCEDEVDVMIRNYGRVLFVDADLVSCACCSEAVLLIDADLVSFACCSEAVHVLLEANADIMIRNDERVGIVDIAGDRRTDDDSLRRR